MNGGQWKALDTSTTLAFERTRIAYERTMMAWIRTAHFAHHVRFLRLQVLRDRDEDVPVFTMLLGPRGFGLALIGTGLLSLGLGVLEHGRDLRALRSRYPDMPRSMSGIVSLVVGALGLFCARGGDWCDA